MFRQSPPAYYDPYEDEDDFMMYQQQMHQNNPIKRKEKTPMIRNIFYLLGSALLGMIILQLL